MKVNHSILFYVDKDNPRGPVPTNPASDPQFASWEDAVQKWAAKNATSSTSTIQAITDDIHTAVNLPTIKIISPLKNQSFTSPSLEVQVSASAPRGISRIEYYLNDNLWQTKWGAASIFSAPINTLGNGYQTLRAKACDDVENCSEDSTTFNLLIKNNPISSGKNSIRLSSPNSDLTVTSTNFPLNAKFLVGHPERLSQLNLIVRDKDNNLITVKTINCPGILRQSREPILFLENYMIGMATL
jgi:hypothetical protein